MTEKEKQSTQMSDINYLIFKTILWDKYSYSHSKFVKKWDLEMVNKLSHYSPQAKQLNYSRCKVYAPQKCLLQ